MMPPKGVRVRNGMQTVWSIRFTKVERRPVCFHGCHGLILLCAERRDLVDFDFFRGGGGFVFWSGRGGGEGFRNAFDDFVFEWLHGG